MENSNLRSISSVPFSRRKAGSKPDRLCGCWRLTLIPERADSFVGIREILDYGTRNSVPGTKWLTGLSVQGQKGSERDRFDSGKQQKPSALEWSWTLNWEFSPCRPMRASSTKSLSGFLRKDPMENDCGHLVYINMPPTVLQNCNTVYGS